MGGGGLSACAGASANLFECSSVVVTGVDTCMLASVFECGVLAACLPDKACMCVCLFACLLACLLACLPVQSCAEVLPACLTWHVYVRVCIFPAPVRMHVHVCCLLA